MKNTVFTFCRLIAIVISSAYLLYPDVCLAEKELTDFYEDIASVPYNADMNARIETDVEDYYKEKGFTAVEFDQGISDLLENALAKSSYFGGGKARLKTLRNSLRKLAEFTGEDGATKFVYYDGKKSTAAGLASLIDDEINELTAKGLFSAHDRDVLRNYTNSVYAIGADRANEAYEQTGHTSQADQIKELAGVVRDSVLTDTCPTLDVIRAKYRSGCWSCLIVEKLSSAFMTAASKAYSLSQKAGLILLGIGAALWVVFWGLRNVSSLTQLEPGNILNELIKFGFKIALAYTFIVLGLRMVSTYFITPIMGVGAKIAEAYWDPEKIKPATEEFVWDDEIVTADENKKIDAAFAQSHAQEETPKEEAPRTEEKPVEALKLPEIAQSNDPYSEIVQDFQKALVQLLNQRLQTLQGSCQESTYSSGGKCNQRGTNSCRHSPCKDKGHRAAVAQIFADAGMNGTYGAYCQVTITAALEQLNEMVGGDIANFQPGVINCRDGMNKAAKYKDASITAPNGGDILLKQALPYANIGDTVYIRVSGATASSVGSASGYHATTYIGNGQVISFNGDGRYNVLSAFGANAVGKIIHLNEIFRQRLKQNPDALKNINRNELSRLAQGSGLMTLVNYTSGVFDGATSFEGSSLEIYIPPVKYSGPTDIMPASVMNSILGATKMISDITSENMVFGDVVMCYATLENGGAWHPFGYTVTNFWMWFEGMFIWCTGLLLTVAIVYYLLDLSFKIGFAVVALPIVVGLWPFDITKDKFSICISIIAKSAATFAFLAMTTTFTVQLTDAVYSYGDEEVTTEADPDAPKGLAKLYEVYDRATLADKGANKPSAEAKAADINYAASKLAIFSTTFVLILFAFLYSFKLVQATVPDLVNKFFPDKAFGNQQPMHHWATAATKWAKDQAMKPVGWARDAALYQGGRLAKNAVGKAVGGVAGSVRSLAGKGKGDAKTVGGMAARGVGNMTTGIGKAISAVGLAKAGAAVQNAGQKVKDAGNQVDKAYNKFATRNKKDDSGNKSDAQKKDGGGK